MRLNEKGQCPPCRRKPLTYKRDGHFFCCRCDRAFSMATGEQIVNWAWYRNEAGEWVNVLSWHREIKA